MKCSKCGNDLRIESDSVEKGKHCSSCEKHDFPECNSIEEVLRWIVQDRGVNVFQNSDVINAGRRNHKNATVSNNCKDN